MYRYYITPTDYEIALSNGISGHILDNRVREYGWDIERACNEPLHRQGFKNILTDEVKEILKANNITLKTFRTRVSKLGWSIEKALNTPIMKKQESIVLAIDKRRVITVEQYEIAKANGISKTALQGRVKRGWSAEKASTTKTFTPMERAKASYFYKTRNSLFKAI